MAPGHASQRGDGKLTIGGLAAATGIPASTLRYYERMRLLAPSSRTEANYRVYGPGAVERLRFIRAAQTAGLTLADIRVLLHHRDGMPAPCSEVRVLLEQRLESIESALRELRHVRGALRTYLEVCRRSSGETPCEVVRKLGRGKNTA